MTPKNRRLSIIVGGLALLAGAVGLTLSALNDNIVFFYSPSDLQAMNVAPDRSIRIGGLVEEGSVVHEDDGVTMRFAVTDGAKTVPVIYKGQVPDLFREGQGVIAQGKMMGGTFQA